MTREELEKLLAAATPGPWFTFANGHCVGGTPADGSASGVAMCSMAARVATEVKANAALIVAAVNALPEMLEENAMLRARLDKSDAAIARVMQTHRPYANESGIVEIPLHSFGALVRAALKETGQ